MIGPAPKIIWQKRETEAWFAWIGGVRIAMVVQRHDGAFHYTVDGLVTRHLTKGHGETTSAKAAKAAVKRAWEFWWSLLDGGPRF